MQQIGEIAARVANGLAGEGTILLWDGAAVAEAGAWANVPIDVYHGGRFIADPYVSSSGLRTLFSQSPAHYWTTSPRNPNRLVQSATAALTLGRATHHLIGGEDGFKRHFVVRPDEIGGAAWHGNRKECQRWLKAAEVAGLSILTSDQMDAIVGMTRSLAAHPLVEAGILSGHTEISMAFQDARSGVWCASRPDVIPNMSGDFADLKTTQSVAYADLARTIAEYRYDMQAAMVRRAALAALGIEMRTYSLVFVETRPPHCCEVVTLDMKDIEEADGDLDVALRMFARCWATNTWPGPGGTTGDARIVRIPEWHRRQSADRRAILEQELMA